MSTCYVNAMLNPLVTDIGPSMWKRVKGLELHADSERCHEAINELLDKTVLSGGKRLRPLLTYVMGEFLQVDLEKLEIPARSIEMVHAASLSHDDVIDQATQRRGNPSINVAASNKKAVLAGDYLLASVIVELTKTGNLELVKEMSHVIQDLAKGEWLQSDASEDRLYSHDILEKIAAYKTASVMSWCCVAPGIIAGYNENTLKQLRLFGHELGIGFQLVDDVLDFSGTSQKDQQLDLKNGIVNSVIYEWLLLNPVIHEQFNNGIDIYELWNEKRSSTGLDKAVAIVSNKASEKLSNCHRILDELSFDLSATNDSNDIAKKRKPVEAIIKFLEKRNI
ncbi:polyprenyl synthetase family protein [Bacteriovoracaceae bacterium]|nr:polyprenyl synthetase family protein [Bacteriovoracaceae bacterium]